MSTGLKTIDNLIQKFGIRTREGADKSQFLITLTGGDIRVNNIKMPYCMMQKVMTTPVNKQLKFHQWYLPHKQSKLACFLINEEGQIIEQVYFQRDTKHVMASKKIETLVARAHRQQFLQSSTLAA